jgi:hypothetical protein
MKCLWKDSKSRDHGPCEGATCILRGQIEENHETFPGRLASSSTVIRTGHLWNTIQE